jgi:hypothetical protein
MKDRIYVVVNGKDEPLCRLVRAQSRAQAIKHVTKNIVCKVAGQQELVDLLTAEVSVEDANVQP